MEAFKTQDVTTLRKVQCTETYQRAKPNVVATLSTGATYTVTAQSSFESSDAAAVSVSGSGGGTVLAGVGAGTASINATYGGSALASTDLTTQDAPAVVQSMSLSGASSLYGQAGSGFGTTLAVTLDDGTVYSDVHSLVWLDATAARRRSGGAGRRRAGVGRHG